MNSERSIQSVTLDEARILRRSAEVEHERRVALTDITHNNEVELLGVDLTPPYDLFISVRENRLLLRFTASDARTHEVTLSLAPYRGIIKDYFLMCEQYYDAIKHSPGDRLQTLDMARRGVHNEGSEMLQQQLAERIRMDFATARRLFTLICVLHIK